MTRLFFGGKRASLRICDSRPAYELRITNESPFAGKNFVCQCTFTARTFTAGVTYRVQGAGSYDTVTFSAAEN